MKTSRLIRRAGKGSVLVITICLAFVIGLSLASYLWLIHMQNKMVSRSQHWHLAMAHAEAGVEEALAQLNHKFSTNLNRAANGWGGPANGVFGPVVRNLRGGAYKATISTDQIPVILSTGYATNAISGGVVSRTVRVNAATASAFQVGMAAKLNITFKGNNVHTDSYDSADPAHDDPLNPLEVKAGGDVASTDGIVDVGNANINGKILTGPIGTYSFGPNGYAGPIGFTGPGLFDSTWYKNDFNADFKDVDPPYDSSSSLPPLEIKVMGKNATNYWLLANGDYYYAGSPALNGMNIVVTGNARLYVTGDFVLPNLGSQIYIGTGATLKLFVGTTAGAAAKTVLTVVNATPGSEAATFQYYGLPSNNDVVWNGNDKFKGTVYAPEAVFTAGGSGSTIYDYQGACVVYEVVMNGHFNFHYDENLKKRDTSAGFVAGSWLEL